MVGERARYQQLREQPQPPEVSLTRRLDQSSSRSRSSSSSSSGEESEDSGRVAAARSLSDVERDSVGGGGGCSGVTNEEDRNLLQRTPQGRDGGPASSVAEVVQKTAAMLTMSFCRNRTAVWVLLALAVVLVVGEGVHQKVAYPWRGHVHWPSVCAGRDFEPPDTCTYDTLPRIGRLTLVDDDVVDNEHGGDVSAAATAIHAAEARQSSVGRQDAIIELVKHIRAGYWRLKPFGCFARDSGAVFFNKRTGSINQRGVNETNLCAPCSLDQALFANTSIGVVGHNGDGGTGAGFVLRHGGKCTDYSGFCPITVPLVCAAAASHFGLQGGEHHLHGKDNVTALLVLMAGSRVGSTWLVKMLDAHPDIHMRGEGSNANPCNDNENETARLREVTRFLNKPGRYRVRGHKLGTMFFNDPASLEVRRMWARRNHLRVICFHRSNSWQQAMSASHKAAMMRACGNKSSDCDGFYPHKLPPAIFWKYFINHRWFNDACWSWAPHAEAVMALEYEELKSNTNAVMSQLWDFIGVDQLDTKVATAEVVRSHLPEELEAGKAQAASQVKADLEAAATQFKMNKDESELKNLDAALKIELIRDMRNTSAWWQKQVPGCNYRRKSQVLPLLDESRVLKWCRACTSAYCDDTEERRFVEDIVPKPYRSTLSLDACHGNY